MCAQVIVEGTLKPAGTLELDQKPTLSPGRVQITVRPLVLSPAGRHGLVRSDGRDSPQPAGQGLPGANSGRNAGRGKSP